MTLRPHSAVLVGLFTIGFGLADTANAALWGRLETTPGSGDYQAYYDDELDITWLADANFARTTGYSDAYSADGSMTWGVANAWAASLTIQGIGGWRLPGVAPINDTTLNYSYAVNGTTDNGFNISAWRSSYAGSTANEVAHLFYNTLGNTGFRNLVGEVLADWSVFNSGPFVNTDSGYYWTGTASGIDPDSAAAFSFGGEQSWGSKDFYFRVWPVHEGDVGGIVDEDGDGVADADDNCVQAPNGPMIPDAGGNSQLDSNGDGYGNACDADLNNDGVVNGLDVGPFINQFGTAGPDADFNGDGAVNGLDVGLFISMFGQAPGPTGQTP